MPLDPLFTSVMLASLPRADIILYMRDMGYSAEQIAEVLPKLCGPAIYTTLKGIFMHSAKAVSGDWKSRPERLLVYVRSLEFRFQCNIWQIRPSV